MNSLSKRERAGPGAKRWEGEGFRGGLICLDRP